MIFPICNKCPDRAPKLFGHIFILCWRCTGLLVGYIIGMCLRLIIHPIGFFGILMLIPISIDGIAQNFFGIMSNNPRRFITGFIGGLISLSGL